MGRDVYIVNRPSALGRCVNGKGSLWSEDLDEAINGKGCLYCNPSEDLDPWSSLHGQNYFNNPLTEVLGSLTKGGQSFRELGKNGLTLCLFRIYWSQPHDTAPLGETVLWVSGREGMQPEESMLASLLCPSLDLWVRAIRPYRQ
jgi:hypothetical protein